MCSNTGVFYEIFTSGAKLDTAILYGHLVHVGIFAAGLSLLRKTQSWDASAKVGAAYISLNLAYMLGLSGLEFLIDENRFVGHHLRFLYLALLVVLCVAVWFTRSPKAVRAAFGTLLLLNAAVVVSFMPLGSNELQISGCGATMTTQAYKSNATKYSEAMSSTWLLRDVPERHYCDSVVETSLEARSLVYHGPFTIRRGDGSVSYGRFSFGTTKDPLIACTSVSEPVEF
ncbi:hypothetical protein FRD01_10075 [Microvenator marinus]|uniref:Uncharacterized protein n=1 Tax=Microvenator marinus TaxID=2600177 RepID=A0A5B8XNW8_9DELT|nr:hypothetical protein [Microvenator marinus]QED27582.1 hypothetical protein FRD01_10075 [Microvenator marinus]